MALEAVSSFEGSVSITTKGRDFRAGSHGSSFFNFLAGLPQQINFFRSLSLSSLQQESNQPGIVFSSTSDL